MPKVFISHSSKDSRFVSQELVPFLEEHGVETWYSVDDICTGDEWERRLREGLKSCEWFLVVISVHSVQSKWVRAEVHWAMDNRQGRVVPLLLDGSKPGDLDLRLLCIHHVDFTEPGDGPRTQLLNLWRGFGATPHPLPASVTSHRLWNRRLAVVCAGVFAATLLILAWLALTRSDSPTSGPAHSTSPLSLEATEVLRTVARLPHDFEVELSTAEPKQVFYEGETVRFRLRVGEHCHVAVFFYGADGSTMLLFPNAWNKETWILKDLLNDIPAKGYDYRVAPPFGADLLQVVACSQASEFHTKVQGYLSKASDLGPFFNLRPDDMTELIALLPTSAEPHAHEARWSESHLVIYQASGAPHAD